MDNKKLVDSIEALSEKLEAVRKAQQIFGNFFTGTS